MLSSDVHEVPGRLRVKIPALGGRPDGNEIVQDLFRNIDGIERVTFNRMTGSVVILYDAGSVAPKALLKPLNDHELLPVEPRPTTGSRIPSLTAEVSRFTARELGRFLMAKVLEHNGMGLLAALI